jgi:hypothetical protein
VDDAERASAIDDLLRQHHFREGQIRAQLPCSAPTPTPVLYVTAGRDGPGRKSFSGAWVALHRLPNEACTRPYASPEPARRCRRQRAQRAPRRCIGAFRLSRAAKRRVAAFELVGRSVSAQLSSLCPAAQANMADMRSGCEPGCLSAAGIVRTLHATACPIQNGGVYEVCPELARKALRLHPFSARTPIISRIAQFRRISL